jgi:hypothetical protein
MQVFRVPFPRPQPPLDSSSSRTSNERSSWHLFSCTILAIPPTTNSFQQSNLCPPKESKLGRILATSEESAWSQIPSHSSRARTLSIENLSTLAARSPAQLAHPASSRRGGPQRRPRRRHLGSPDKLKGHNGNNRRSHDDRPIRRGLLQPTTSPTTASPPIPAPLTAPKPRSTTQLPTWMHSAGRLSQFGANFSTVTSYGCRSPVGGQAIRGIHHSLALQVR